MVDKKKQEEIEDFEMEATEGFELVRVDEGAYDVELTKLVKIPNVKVVRNNIEEIVDMLRWTFTTPDGIELPGTSSTKFGPKSKGFAWACTLLGEEIETGKILKPKDLVGHSCQVVVKDKTRVTEFAGKKDEQIFSIVTDVLAMKKAKTSEKEKDGKKGK